ncbi:MAG: MaoC family dehydratase N-terminal domain-containing protein, partial [Propionibacteriaceae bacterium]|nr:MaoC family dehydratase N-terminal domain-containing protein [Propionibacteriaceae bacterium]
MTWQDWIGRTTTKATVLDPAQADRMNVTLDREPGFRTGDELPPAWQWLYFHDLVPASRLGEEGHPALGETMPPVPLPRRMWASGTLVFHRPLILGSEVERTTVIASIEQKQGRTGPMYFVTVQHDYRCDGALCLAEKQTIVYREMVGAGAGVPESTPEAADFRATWSLDSTALF